MTEQQQPSEGSQQPEQQAPVQPPAPPAYTPPTDAALEAKRWATILHLTAFAGFFIPLGNFVGPLLVWLMKKEEFAMVDEHGKAALNFHISATIAAIICFFLIFVGIGIVLLPLVGLFVLVEVVINAVRASNGESPRYHLTIDFIK